MSRKNANTPRQRRQLTPEQKATILRRHLADKVPVSDLCDEFHVQPSLVYLWQRQALEHLSAALQDGRTRRGESQTLVAERARVATLEANLAKKDAAIAAISALKNTWGELRRSRYAAANAHDGLTPREHWLTAERARERFPHARPRIISDNGPQFIARNFKGFIRSVA